MQEQPTKLEIMCAEMQNENEQLIREAAQHKQFVQEEVTKRKTEENTIEVIKLCKDAVKLLNAGDDHAAEQCYLQALDILPQHAQSLCQYAYMFVHRYQKNKSDRTQEFLDKAEELYKQALQAEPHRAPTLFNYAAYLLVRQQVREARDMYARAC